MWTSIAAYSWKKYECRLDRYDTIGAPSARKLSALALCVLLTLPLPALLERLDVILPHVTGTWLEVCRFCGGWRCLCCAVASARRDDADHCAAGFIRMLPCKHKILACTVL